MLKKWIRFKKKVNSTLGHNLNPAQVLVLGFATVILIGALMLTTPFASRDGQSVGFVNALFTATSATCVTGLVVVDTQTHWTLFGQLVIITLIQIGGLGFMTMATMAAFLAGKKISLKSRLIMQEALGQFNIAGVVRLTQYVIIITFAIEAIGAVALSTVFIPEYGWIKGVYYSCFHSISAFCNAGFDLIGNYRSLTPYVGNPIVNITIMSLIVTGGIGFMVVLDIMRAKSFKGLTTHSKLVLSITAALILGGAFSIFIMEYNNPATLGSLSMGEKILASFFHSVTPRTAGFNTLAMDKLHMSTVFLTIILMFIGGSPSSTAGGIKTTTFGLVILAVYAVIKGNEDIVVFKRTVSKDTVLKSMAILVIFLSVVIAVTMGLSVTEGNQTFIALLFETTSGLATVGLTLGITPSLSIQGKVMLTLAMFLGRVGPLTLVIALLKRHKVEPRLRYPEGKILVG